MKTKFGGGRSSGFCFVYDDIDARKKYDMKTSLIRVSTRATAKLRMRGVLAVSSARLDCSNGAFVSPIFLRENLNYYFNRTKSSTRSRNLPERWPRNSKARDFGSRVPPRARSSPARQRSEDTDATMSSQTFLSGAQASEPGSDRGSPL